MPIIISFMEFRLKVSVEIIGEANSALDFSITNQNITMVLPAVAGANAFKNSRLRVDLVCQSK
jgi:hypothetical protein